MLIDSAGNLQRASCCAQLTYWTTTGNSQVNSNYYLGTMNNADLIFRTNSSNLPVSASERMRITANGKVVIGAGLNIATSYNYGLYVANGILTEKVKVAIKTSNDWQDKVFDKKYRLGTLAETEEFISKYHHLPGIPSADEVVASGIDVSEMFSSLLQKIEELTLHQIELEKEIKELKLKQ